MSESTTWIIICIGAVAISAMGFASITHERETQVQVIGFGAVICTTLLTFMQSRQTAARANVAAQKADVAAEKADLAATSIQENSVHTDERLEGLRVVAINTQRTGDAVYKLSNSAMAAQLKLNALVSKRLAVATRGTATGEMDMAAAEEAERIYQLHQARQSVIDHQPGGPPTVSDMARAKEKEAYGRLGLMDGVAVMDEIKANVPDVLKQALVPPPEVKDLKEGTT